MKLAFSILFFILIQNNVAFADGQITPCMVFKNGTWQLINKNKKRSKKGLNCIQNGRNDYLKIVNRLVTLKHFKEKKIPLLEEKIRLKDKEIKTLGKIIDNWKNQVTLYKELTRYNQKESQVWKESFFKLKALKKPNSIFDNPIFWFTVGAITTATITISIVYATK